MARRDGNLEARFRNAGVALLAAGFLLLAAGFFLSLVFGRTAWWNAALAGLGALLLSAYLWVNRASVRESGRRRSTQVRASLALVAAAVFGIAAAVNYIFQRHPVRFDLTEEKRFSLAPQTHEVLDALERPVTVTMFYSERRTLPEVFRARALLEEYDKAGGDFLEFRAVDADKNPSEARRYGIKEYNTVVFESGENRKDVLQRDYITYALGAGRQPEPKFQGEKVFTSAILAMTAESQKTVYFTEGHGEKDLASPEPNGLQVLKDVLEKENYRVGTVNLLKEGKVPEDAGVLAVAGPEKPFHPSEEKLLLDWLKQGGGAVLWVDPGVNPGLSRVLGAFGVGLGEDVVVDRTSFAFPDIRALIPKYRFHAVTEKLMDAGVVTIFPFARSVRQEDPELEGAQRTVLLETTAEGWGETRRERGRARYDEGEDVKGPVPLAQASEWSPKESPETKARLVVFGSSTFPTNQMEGAPGNRDLAVNAVNWTAEEESKISIRPKEEKRRELVFSNVEANAVKVLVIFLLPLSVLATGVWVWFRRRAL